MGRFLESCWGARGAQSMHPSSEPPFHAVSGASSQQELLHSGEVRTPQSTHWKSAVWAHSQFLTVKVEPDLGVSLSKFPGGVALWFKPHTWRINGT